MQICTSSDGGKNFYPLKEATDCTSCGEKVVSFVMLCNSHHTGHYRQSFALIRASPVL